MQEKPNYYAIIPANVRYAKIPPMAKLLFAEITALSNKNGYCHASNTYFANLYEMSTKRISELISILIKNNFIESEVIRNDKQEVIERKLYLSRKISIPIEKNKDTPIPKNRETPPPKNVKENITSKIILQDINISDSKESQTTQTHLEKIETEYDLDKKENQETPTNLNEINSKHIIDEYHKVYKQKLNIEYDYSKADFGNAKNLTLFINKQTDPITFLKQFINKAFDDQFFTSNASISLLYSQRNKFNPLNKSSPQKYKNDEHLRCDLDTQSIRQRYKKLYAELGVEV